MSDFPVKALRPITLHIIREPGGGSGSGSRVLQGEGPPSSEMEVVFQDGDKYLDTVSGILYEWEDG